MGLLLMWISSVPEPIFVRTDKTLLDHVVLRPLSIPIGLDGTYVDLSQLDLGCSSSWFASCKLSELKFPCQVALFPLRNIGNLKVVL